MALWRPYAVSGAAPDDGFTRVAGVVHVHTTVSDGGGTPEEVIASARQAGLDFLAITDHNILDAKRLEGVHGSVLVLVGTEISTTAGHVLALGLADPDFRFSGGARDGLEDVRDLGGRAWAAHPTSPREDFRWAGWDLPGSWGVELLNGDSQWREAGTARLARTALLYGLSPRYALLGSLTSPASALERWDALLRERDASGITGADAHSRVPVARRFALRFPSYESLFGLARNHVLLEEPLQGRFEVDAPAVLDALAGGRSYVGLDALAPADGFFFVADSADRRVTMGGTIRPAADLRLRAGGRVPEQARLVLRRDGQKVAESERALEVPAESSGVYRVEAWLPGWEVPWVISNPIYVFDAGSAVARARRAEWPPEPPAPEPALVADAFEGGTVFAAGKDPNSRCEALLPAPGEGTAGSGAAQLAFRLASPTDQNPHPFCALVDWTHRDLRGRQGLVFSLRADGVYRAWVQVRDANPASADEGTEWWFGSIKTSLDWRRVAVPFASLRSINPRTDGRLDLDRVRALVFLLDRGTMKPEIEGRVWIDDIGLY